MRKVYSITIKAFILLFLLFLIVQGVIYNSARAETIDPTITPSKTLICEMPTDREDGTPLPLGEIAEIRFYVSMNQTRWDDAGTNTICLQVYDLSGVADGIYYYKASAVDTDGRESIKTPEVVTLEVKRLSPPAPPSSIGWLEN